MAQNVVRSAGLLRAAAVKRCLADQLWSKDGFIEPAAWTMAQNVVRSAGLLKQEVPYEDVIDMRFVKR